MLEHYLHISLISKYCLQNIYMKLLCRPARDIPNPVFLHFPQVFVGLFSSFYNALLLVDLNREKNVEVNHEMSTVTTLGARSYQVPIGDIGND